MSKFLVFRTLSYSMHNAPEIFCNEKWSERNIWRFGRMFCEKKTGIVKVFYLPTDAQ